MKKLYAYVDESGQDTEGTLFIVSVVIAGHDRDNLMQKLEEIEQTSGKGKVKWIESKDSARFAYMQTVLALPEVKGRLHYAAYHNSKDYLALTVLTIARAILVHAEGDYKATIFIDALQDAHRQWVGTELRHLHIRTKKIRGIKRDETNALIRLADAICGLVRTKNADLHKLLLEVEESGIIHKL